MYSKYDSVKMRIPKSKIRNDNVLYENLTSITKIVLVNNNYQ